MKTKMKMRKEEIKVKVEFKKYYESKDSISRDYAYDIIINGCRIPLILNTTSEEGCAEGNVQIWIDDDVGIVNEFKIETTKSVTQIKKYVEEHIYEIMKWYNAIRDNILKNMIEFNVVE